MSSADTASAHIAAAGRQQSTIPVGFMADRPAIPGALHFSALRAGLHVHIHTLDGPTRGICASAKTQRARILTAPFTCGPLQPSFICLTMWDDQARAYADVPQVVALADVGAAPYRTAQGLYWHPRNHLTALLRPPQFPTRSA